MTADLDALIRAGLRDSVLTELKHRALDDLVKLAALSDAELRDIPLVGDKAVAVIRACIAAA